MLTFDDKAIVDKSIFDSVPGLEFNLRHIRKNKIEKYEAKAYLRRVLGELVEY